MTGRHVVAYAWVSDGPSAPAWVPQRTWTFRWTVTLYEQRTTTRPHGLARGETTTSCYGALVAPRAYRPVLLAERRFCYRRPRVTAFLRVHRAQQRHSTNILLHYCRTQPFHPLPEPPRGVGHLCRPLFVTRCLPRACRTTATCAAHRVSPTHIRMPPPLRTR